MPLFVYDIAADGTATKAVGDALSGPAALRWWHFDRADPDLPGWADTHLPAIPAQTLLMPETRPRCDRYDGGLMVNLRGVNLNADGPEDQMVALRMWITPAAIVTVRVRRVYAIDAIEAQLKDGHAPTSLAGFIDALARALTTRIQTSVFDLADAVDALEDTAETQTPPAADLADLRRKAIRLRRYLGPQRDALVALAAEEMMQSRALHLQELANLAMLNVEELDSLAARLTAIHDHHAARASEAQSRNGYALSVVAAVFLPLGFATGLFGVNVAGMPGTDTPAAFWLLSASMIVMAVFAIAILRWLKWI